MAYKNVGKNCVIDKNVGNGMPPTQADEAKKAGAIFTPGKKLQEIFLLRSCFSLARNILIINQYFIYLCRKYGTNNTAPYC
jgi:hypothetical protein